MPDSTASVSQQTGIPSYEDYVKNRTVNKELGKNEFLNLLATQLKYQDPLEPMKDSEFVAQLAQFSSLEQMQNLNDVMSKSYYFGLANKQVSATVYIDGVKTLLTGMVDSIFYQDGKPYAVIGEYIIDATKIDEVHNTDMLLLEVLLNELKKMFDSLGGSIDLLAGIGEKTEPVKDPEDTDGDGDKTGDIDDTDGTGGGNTTEPGDDTGGTGGTTETGGDNGEDNP